MAQYKILGGNPVWPIGESLKLVRKVGGLRNVPKDQRGALRFCKCSPGDIVDDVPAESVPALIAQGAIERVSKATLKTNKGAK